MRASLWVFFAVFASGCGRDEPIDDDCVPTDDDIASDDDSMPDVCEQFPGEIICVEGIAISCDVFGNTTSSEECSVLDGLECHEGLGCVSCFPGERWCEDLTVQECGPSGLTHTTVDVCDESTGEACITGECYSLCDLAALEESSQGCRFYGVYLEQNHEWPLGPYAIAVSNVDDVFPANVTFETFLGGGWLVEHQAVVLPLNSETHKFDNHEISGTGIGAGYGYRVNSDVPLIAYQFNPLDGDNSFSSDASLLIPSTAFEEYHRIPGWGCGNSEHQHGTSTLAVVAAQDGTQVTVTPTANSAAGGSVPEGFSGVPLGPIVLNEGDVLQVTGATTAATLAGSEVDSTLPVGVFAGHQCANVPQDESACDHIEEQIAGVSSWGVEVVGARMPVRRNPPEVSVWQFYGGHTATVLTFEAPVEVTGLPEGNSISLGAGEMVEMRVSGSASRPGDFHVVGTAPFSATQYMAGAGTVTGSQAGDPCMAQSVPVEQYRTNYVVLVPTTWENDRFILSRQSGTVVTVDGIDIDHWEEWSPVTPVASGWEVVRLEVEDGVHVLEGDAPFGVLVVGFDEWDSYCYPGGMDLSIINDE